MAIAVNATARKTATGANATMTTSALTTTVSNCLLLAFCIGNSAGNTGTVTGISGISTWHEVITCNGVSGGGDGFVSIWRTFSTGIVSAQTIQVSWSPSTNGLITLVAFSGCITTGVDGAGAIGASSEIGGATGAPSRSLVTTADNSWVWAGLDDWSNSVTPTTPGGQTRQDIFNNTTDGDTSWVQSTTSATPTSGTTVTINCTTPTTDIWNIAMCEILAAQGGDTVTAGQNYAYRIS